MHIMKEYEPGVGHIEARGEQFLVSFYTPYGSRRVRQVVVDSLEVARRELRRMAMAME